MCGWWQRPAPPSLAFLSTERRQQQRLPQRALPPCAALLPSPPPNWRVPAGARSSSPQARDGPRRPHTAAPTLPPPIHGPTIPVCASLDGLLWAACPGGGRGRCAGFGGAACVQCSGVPATTTTTARATATTATTTTGDERERWGTTGERRRRGCVCVVAVSAVEMDVWVVAASCTAVIPLATAGPSTSPGCCPKTCRGGGADLCLRRQQCAVLGPFCDRVRRGLLSAPTSPVHLPMCGVQGSHSPHQYHHHHHRRLNASTSWDTPPPQETGTPQ